MEQTFYLLTSLIEKTSDSISDTHRLFGTLEKAESAFLEELKECSENFDGQDGDLLIDLPRCREWRNGDGFGYTVTVEEVTPL